ncbi:phage tail family protein [Paenibacillus sp. ACRRX]|uniref:distal tail protein Dit n=1 Tax=Paenibacillus sp. ACRRX TaxID=2918206 RepID=UPI001EF62E5C|nr:distal tail protein Dit [Paenibacillus sp. ACRRX]MCG7406384.1 phage tail family protein [Paenibacillus sp. ACRRX]
MTIRNAEYFTYNGISSQTFGIVNVNVSGGLLEEAFAPTRNITEFRIAGRDKPYSQTIQKEPLKFHLTFAFEEGWDTSKIREVTKWLTEVDYYKELSFSTDPERIFYAIVVDDPTLLHNGMNEGYLTLTFRCSSPYSYSPVYTSQIYEFQDRTYEQTIDTFDKGQREGIILNAQGHLVLDPSKPTWQQYSPPTKWSDIP